MFNKVEFAWKFRQKHPLKFHPRRPQPPFNQLIMIYLFLPTMNLPTISNT